MGHAFFGGNAIVADDRQVIRNTLRSSLGSTWRVFAASNGIEAVEYARNVQADLLILDINMEPLNGIDASAEIRDLPGYATVPMVILTGYDSKENRLKARFAGVDAVLTKPFTTQDLLAVVRPLVEHRRIAAEPSTTQSDQTEARNTLAVYRKFDAAPKARPYDRFVDWAKAQRWDSRR